MIITITIGWWILPAILSLLAVLWCNSLDYGGDYNFTGAISLPITAFVICFVWMVYFGVRLALS